MRAAVKRSVSGPGAVFEEFGGEEMFTDSSKDSGNSSIFMIAVDVNSRFVVLTFRERKIILWRGRQDAERKIVFPPLYLGSEVVSQINRTTSFMPSS